MPTMSIPCEVCQKGSEARILDDRTDNKIHWFCAEHCLAFYDKWEGTDSFWKKDAEIQ